MKAFSRRYSPQPVTGSEEGCCSSECNQKLLAAKCPASLRIDFLEPAFLPRRQRNQVGRRIFIEED
jgi:hypothetical protein